MFDSHIRKYKTTQQCSNLISTNPRRHNKQKVIVRVHTSATTQRKISKNFHETRALGRRGKKPIYTGSCRYVSFFERLVQKRNHGASHLRLRQRLVSTLNDAIRIGLWHAPRVLRFTQSPASSFFALLLLISP